MELFILILEIVGTVSFALSGAMTGLKKNMDIFGVCVLGVTTAVGGGILRDLLLGLTPPAGAVPQPQAVRRADADLRLCRAGHFYGVRCPGRHRRGL